MQPNPAVLVGLRAIDDTLDCHYIGDGSWVVGSVKDDQRRRDNGRARVRQLRADSFGYRVGLLQLQGFTTIAVFEDVCGGLTSEHVEDIRCVDWRYNHERRMALEEALDIAEGLPEKEKKLAHIADHSEAWALDQWATMFRGKKSFSVPRALAAV